MKVDELVDLLGMMLAEMRAVGMVAAWAWTMVDLTAGEMVGQKDDELVGLLAVMMVDVLGHWSVGTMVVMMVLMMVGLSVAV